eukprot:7384526-Prymnesium_polylepis.3
MPGGYNACGDSSNSCGGDDGSADHGRGCDTRDSGRGESGGGGNHGGRDNGSILSSGGDCAIHSSRTVRPSNWGVPRRTPAE